MGTQNQLGERVIRKVKWHIIPMAFILYFFNGMDRVNLSYSALTMNKALNISSVMFGTISAIFFIAYLIFQIPSNILLQRVGVNKVIPTITILWGLITAATFFSQNATQMATFRFLLGLAEAGFFPGMIFYFTLWFPERERAQITAMFFLSGPLSGLVASPLSGWIVGNAHWFGFDGWRWLFAIEGIPTVFLGILAYSLLKDGPQYVKWLTKEESTWLSNELRTEQECKGKVQPLSFRRVITNKTLWRLACIYMFVQAGNQVSNFWLPTLVKSFSSSFSSETVGLLMMIPNLVGLVVLPIWATHSDKTGERKQHTALPMLFIGVSFITFLFGSNMLILIFSLLLFGMGAFNYFGSYWTLPPKLLAPEFLAVGIAFINSCSSFGGFIGNYAVGYVSKVGGTTGVFLFMAGLCLLSYLLLITMKVPNDVPKKDQQKA
jgi:ACS family tartrate transporter-like MFS transporter